MGSSDSRGSFPRSVEALLERILVDSHGDDEQLWALREAIHGALGLPVDAFIIGEPVSVIGVDYDGNVRRGLEATCHSEDGSRHVISLADVRFAPRSKAARSVAAYRMWLGLGPLSAPRQRSSGPLKRHKARPEDLDLDKPVDMIVLAVRQNALRCRLLETSREITFRCRGVWRVVPGEIITVRADRQWRYGGHSYLTGDLKSSRLDAEALGLVPLDLFEQGTWDPAEQYWGEEGEPLEDWAVPLVERGPRPQFEMEQVVPGRVLSDPDDDPILRAVELGAAGRLGEARRLLMDLLAADLRCLDAHAHLGTHVFEHDPRQAFQHYSAGVRIGERSLGVGFDGVLPWGLIDNRPFMRCLHGFGLCLWRLGRLGEAATVFERLLWLNPSDNQGARFLNPAVRAGEPWEDHRDS